MHCDRLAGRERTKYSVAAARCAGGRCAWDKWQRRLMAAMAASVVTPSTSLRLPEVRSAPPPPMLCCAMFVLGASPALVEPSDEVQDHWSIEQQFQPLCCATHHLGKGCEPPQH